MTRWRDAGRYDENEVQALIDNYLELRFLKHRPSIHVRLMDLERALRMLPRKFFEVVLVYGVLRFTSRAAAENLAISDREVRRRYRKGFEQIMQTLNGDEDE